MTDNNWTVHKFGGSSVADADCFPPRGAHRGAGRRATGDRAPACRGVTDALLNMVALAEHQDASYEARLGEIRERHIQIAESILKPGGAAAFIAELKADCRDIHGILQTVQLIRSAAQNVRDLVAGYGRSGRRACSRPCCANGPGPPALSNGSMRAGSWWSSGASSGQSCNGTNRNGACRPSSRRGLPEHLW